MANIGNKVVVIGGNQNASYYIPDYRECLDRIAENVEYIKCHLKGKILDIKDPCK